MSLLDGRWAALPPLVCPGCRRVHEGRLWYSLLEPHPAGLVCPGCGLVHPVVDGVPIVLRDPDAWLSTEAPAVFARRDLPDPVRVRLLEGAGGVLARDERLAQSYAAPLDSPLHAAVNTQLAELSGLLLDVGAGAGLGEHAERRVAMDLHFGLARAHPGVGVVGDAADPPFEAERFDGVLLLNVLDSCADPRLVLGQADALLRPGGQLLIAVAWAWSDAVTPPRLRFDAARLHAALGGDPRALGLRLAYRTEHAEDGLIWRLAAGPRTVHEHRCALLRLRKLGTPHT